MGKNSLENSTWESRSYNQELKPRASNCELRIQTKNQQLKADNQELIGNQERRTKNKELKTKNEEPEKWPLEISS